VRGDSGEDAPALVVDPRAAGAGSQRAERLSACMLPERPKSAAPRHGADDRRVLRAGPRGRGTTAAAPLRSVRFTAGEGRQVPVGSVRQRVLQRWPGVRVRGGHDQGLRRPRRDCASGLRGRRSLAELRAGRSARPAALPGHAGTSSGGVGALERLPELEAAGGVRGDTGAAGAASRLAAGRAAVHPGAPAPGRASPGTRAVCVGACVRRARAGRRLDHAAGGGTCGPRGGESLAASVGWTASGGGASRCARSGPDEV